MGAPKSDIGGSGITAPRLPCIQGLAWRPSPLLELLCAAGAFCRSLCLGLFGLFHLCLLRLWGSRLEGRFSPLGRLLFFAAEGALPSVVVPLGFLGGGASVGKPCLDWTPWCDRKGRSAKWIEACSYARPSFHVMGVTPPPEQRKLLWFLYGYVSGNWAQGVHFDLVPDVWIDCFNSRGEPERLPFQASWIRSSLMVLLLAGLGRLSCGCVRTCKCSSGFSSSLAVVPGHQLNTSASPARLSESDPPAVHPARQCKLSQEPPSRSAQHRETLNRVRAFVVQEGRDWPVLPANDPFALQEDLRLHRNLLVEAVPEQFTFGILIPGFVTETVALELTPPLEVADALRLLSQEREQVQARVFPRLVAITPQLAQSYGLVLALPAWAEEEVFICLDLLDIDNRLYVESAPSVADRPRLLRLAGLPEQAPIDIYIGESAVPMQMTEEAELFQGLCVFFTPQHDLPGPFFRLAETLLSSDSWEALPDVPTGLDTASMCGVGETGHREVCFDGGAAFADTSVLARAFQISVHLLRLQPVIPQLRDVAEHGRICRGVYAISSAPSSDQSTPGVDGEPVLGVVDCRGLLQGWHLLHSETGEVPYGELADLLSTFAPPGWRLYLEGATVVDDALRYDPGSVIYASYLPVAAQPVLAGTPLEEADSEALEDDAVISDVDMPLSSAGPRPSSAPELDIRDRSRSRSPHRSVSPSRVRPSAAPALREGGRSSCSSPRRSLQS
eukprot:s602_g4.t2